MFDLSNMINAIKEAKPKTSAYDTTAEVRRIDGETAWVHIPGGADETPVRMTVNASEGDTVQVRVSGGDAFIVGNQSAPPTDDKAVKKVSRTLTAVQKVVETVKEIADTTSKIAGNTNQYFWHTETGTDTGAHITEIPQDDFIRDPTNGGGNLLARSNGIAIREGLAELATFASDLVELGKNSVSAVIEMCAGKLKIVASGYGASMSTENTYTDGNPLTHYSILTLISEHIYNTYSAVASIALWAGTQGQTSRINYNADDHIFSGKITLGSASISDNANIVRYDTTTETNANSFPCNTIVRLNNNHGVSNTPVTSACFIHSVGRSTNDMVQYCTPASTSNYTLYMRKCSGGTWGTWKSITFS